MDYSSQLKYERKCFLKNSYGLFLFGNIANVTHYTEDNRLKWKNFLHPSKNPQLLDNHQFELLYFGDFF